MPRRTLPEVIRIAIEARLDELHTGMPAQVKSYDAAKQVADVVLVTKQAARAEDGSTALDDFPVIPDVPVRWPKAGGYYLHLPLAAGDWVQLIFNESEIAQWRATGQVPSPPMDLTRHSLSYPVALPCAGPDDDLFDDAPASGQAVLVVPDGGFLRVTTASGSADFVACASLVKARLDAIQAAFDAHVHPTGVGPSGPPASPIGALAAVACVSLKAELP